jgi:hypothetical protein
MSLHKPSLKNCTRITFAALVATLVLGSMNAFSQSDSPLANDRPDTYVVQVGDTLWDIAETFLKDPWYWPEIWYINPDIVNPHLIYPGDILGLIYVEGRQMVAPIQVSSYRLSPEARETPLSEAVTSVSYDSIAAFLSTGAILEKSQIRKMPYLLATRGDHLIAAAGNWVYIRGLEDDTVGQRLNVVHVGRPLIDPEDNRLVGYQATLVATGTLNRGGDPATLVLTDSTMEAKQGDVVISTTVELPLNFFPRAPSSNIDGQIIAVVGGVTQIGQYQVVIMNRGTDDGLAVGDVLTVFQKGPRVRDRVRGGSVTLPDEAAGTVMVFKLFDDIGYGLVMEATEALHVADFVRNPI